MYAPWLEAGVEHWGVVPHYGAGFVPSHLFVAMIDGSCNGGLCPGVSFTAPCAVTVGKHVCAGAASRFYRPLAGPSDFQTS